MKNSPIKKLSRSFGKMHTDYIEEEKEQFKIEEHLSSSSSSSDDDKNQTNGYRIEASFNFEE